MLKKMIFEGYLGFLISQNMDCLKCMRLKKTVSKALLFETDILP